MAALLGIRQQAAATQSQALSNDSAHCSGALSPSLGQCQQLNELLVCGRTLWEVTQVASSLRRLTRLEVLTSMRTAESEVCAPGASGMCAHYLSSNQMPLEPIAWMIG